MQNTLSWKPVLKGKRFCSPACGGGCKRSEYDDALKAATLLAKKMGKKWKAKVWENLGWHSKVTCGKLTVRAPFIGLYTVDFDGSMQFSSSDKDPRKALGSLMHKVLDFTARLEEEVRTAVISAWR